MLLYKLIEYIINYHIIDPLKKKKKKQYFLPRYNIMFIIFYRNSNLLLYHITYTIFSQVNHYF